VSEQRSAREVVEGIAMGFAAVDSNQVREALEAHDSPGDVLAALGELGDFQDQVIDPEIDWVTVGIWTVRDGRLVGMHNFLTREDALAALEKGLP
jgi:hypothetical protein